MPPSLHTGWASWWTRLCLVALVFEAVTGLLVTFAPFHPAVEWGLLVHTLLGLAVIVPLTVYVVLHDDRQTQQGVNEQTCPTRSCWGTSGRWPCWCAPFRV